MELCIFLSHDVGTRVYHLSRLFHVLSRISHWLMLPMLDIIEFRHTATEVMLRLPGLGSGRDETNLG